MRVANRNQNFQAAALELRSGSRAKETAEKELNVENKDDGRPGEGEGPDAVEAVGCEAAVRGPRKTRPTRRITRPRAQEGK
mmetsp:Transcript_17801/g.46968  ORF Transcript_17801/g.46968 Transcript_17801/m.46968 type:complete len:81 (+) Transcript_17801:653-895(+)